MHHFSFRVINELDAIKVHNVCIGPFKGDQKVPSTEFIWMIQEEDTSKFLEEAKGFKEKPKYEAPAVNLQELTKQVQSFKPRVDAIRRTPLAERRNQSTFERVFETDEDNDIGGGWFTRPRPSKRSRMRPFRGFGPSMFM